MDGQLYYKGLKKPSTNRKGELRKVSVIESSLGDERLYKLGFVYVQKATMLNEMGKKLPSASDITKADDIELQEIMENAAKSTEDLITQFKGEETLTMRELLGLNEQLKSIRGVLKVEVEKKVNLEEKIKEEWSKPEEIRDNPEYDDGCEETSGGGSPSVMMNLRPDRKVSISLREN